VLLFFTAVGGGKPWSCCAVAWKTGVEATPPVTFLATGAASSSSSRISAVRCHDQQGTGQLAASHNQPHQLVVPCHVTLQQPFVSKVKL
jgi:hypothetical protein